jgi:hypothetical protein
VLKGVPENSIRSSLGAHMRSGPRPPGVACRVPPAVDLGEPGEASASTLKRLMRLRDVLRAVVEDCYAELEPSIGALRSIARGLPPISMQLEVGGEPPIASWVVRSSSWAFIEAEVIRSCLGFLSGPARARLRRLRQRRMSVSVRGCVTQRWSTMVRSRNLWKRLKGSGVSWPPPKRTMTSVGASAARGRLIGSLGSSSERDGDRARDRRPSRSADKAPYA